MVFILYPRGVAKKNTIDIVSKMMTIIWKLVIINFDRKQLRDRIRFKIWVFIIFNPFRPEFTIVIFIHYKPRIAVAILDL